MTSTNQIFDIRRFWKYVCYDLRINNKEYLKALGVTALFFLFIIAMQYIFLGSLAEVEADAVALYSGYIVVTAIITRERARKNIVKKHGLEYLISVPASNFEKFLNTTLIQVVIGLIIGVIFALLNVAIYTFAKTNDFSFALYLSEFKSIFTLNHLRESGRDFSILLFLIYTTPISMNYIFRSKVRPDLHRIFTVIYYLFVLIATTLLFIPLFVPLLKVSLSLIALSIIVFCTLGIIYFYFVLKNISYNEKTSDNAKKFYF